MKNLDRRLALPAMLAALAASACNGGIPATGVERSAAPQAAPLTALRPADDTSMLERLTKDVVIGSTVDPKNGDTGPRAVAVVKSKFGLKKGQLLVCNYADASGVPGNGTTIEVLDSKPNGTPAQWAQSNNIKGCVGDALTTVGNQEYAAGQTSGVVAWFDQNGNFKKTFGSPLVRPLSNADAFLTNFYEPEFIFTSDAKTGAIVSLSAGHYGNGKLLQVVTGFAVNKGRGWSALGPSGLSYDKSVDTLYVVDGVDDT